jgi:hypothetical protein
MQFVKFCCHRALFLSDSTFCMKLTRQLGDAKGQDDFKFSVGAVVT